MSYLVFHKSGSSLFNYTMEFLSEVAKTLPNAVFHFQKACNFKAFRSFRCERATTSILKRANSSILTLPSSSVLEPWKKSLKAKCLKLFKNLKRIEIAAFYPTAILRSFLSAFPFLSVSFRSGKGAQRIMEFAPNRIDEVAPGHPRLFPLALWKRT